MIGRIDPNHCPEPHISITHRLPILLTQSIMASSFLPKPFTHHYEIAPEYAKSAVYFSCEFAIDQSFKIYSGGLGFLAGSHMRSAADLRQNLCGIGILWTYGYYNQARGEDRELAIQFRKKEYAFLQDTGIRFTVPVHGHPVWVKAMFLPGDIFGTVPMFFLSTDVEENDALSRAITHRLYDQDHLRRIAQYIILGAGGARLLDELGVDPEVWHLNEAHGLSAAFHLYEKHHSLEEVKKRLVFTTHTPEEAGNERHGFNLLRDFSFFGGVPEDEVREITGIEGDEFNHSLAALRLARIANGVSKLHGEVSRQMWKDYPDICEITHVTNAQNKKYWADHGLEHARTAGDPEELRHRKRELKERLFRVVADQTGKLFKPDVLTIVWARRFAGYKRPDLITRDIQLVPRDAQQQQVPGADHLGRQTLSVRLRRHRDLQPPHPPHQGLSERHRARRLRTRTLALPEKRLRHLAQQPGRHPRGVRHLRHDRRHERARSTSPPTTAGSASSPRTAKTPSSSRTPTARLSPEDRDRHDLLGFYKLLNEKVLPTYYDRPDDWSHIVLNSMNDVVPFFDADRMADEYYKKIYASK